MKKSSTLAVALVTALFASCASADAAFKIDPAGGSCGLLDGFGNVISTQESSRIETQSSNGNVKLSCTVKGIATLIGAAKMEYDYESTGILCKVNSLFYGECYSEQHHGVVSEDDNYDGEANAKLTCHVKAIRDCPFHPEYDPNVE